MTFIEKQVQLRLQEKQRQGYNYDKEDDELIFLRQSLTLLLEEVEKCVPEANSQEEIKSFYHGIYYGASTLWG